MVDLLGVILKLNVLGGYGKGNLGDDALMYVIDRMFPRTEKVYYCENRLYINKLLGRKIRVLDQTLFYRASGVLLYGGGTLFYSHTQVSNNKTLTSIRKILKVLKEPKALYNYLLPYLFSKSKKVASCYMVGVGFGPFNNNKTQIDRAVYLAKKCDGLYVRDFASMEFLAANNLTANKIDDVCFSSIFKEIIPVKSLDQSAPVGFVFRDWFKDGGKELNESYMLKVQEYVRAGNECNFYVFSKDDVESIRFIESLINERGLKSSCLKIWDPTVQDISEYLNTLYCSSIIFSSRYHGLVFSMILEIPVVSVQIDQKLDIAVKEYKVVGFDSESSVEEMSSNAKLISDLSVKDSIIKNNDASIRLIVDSVLSSLD